ncbi:MAG: FG-GAP repeat domain-containing protein [Polyangiaceae bacterium]
MLVALEQTAPRVWQLAASSPHCHQSDPAGPVSPGGRIVVSDFTGDGLPDVLVENPVGIEYELHDADGHGGYQCHGDVIAGPRAGQTFGAFDLDGDGRQDFFEGTELLHDTTSDRFAVIAHLNRGDGTFTTEAPVEVPVPAGGGAMRGALRDVTGDGVPELVVAIQESTGPLYLALSLPALAPLSIDPAALARVDLDRLGSRRADLDGDGLADGLMAGRMGWSQTALAMAYGKPSGDFETPWIFTSKGQLGTDKPVLDVADADGDGCLDVLLGGAGLSVFSGWHCAPR